VNASKQDFRKEKTLSNKSKHEKQGFTASLLYLLLELSKGFEKLGEQEYKPGSVQRHC
jgi:hypothetical protein